MAKVGVLAPDVTCTCIFMLHARGGYVAGKLGFLLKPSSLRKRMLLGGTPEEEQQDSQRHLANASS
jgi:hypothetical protein